MTPCMSVWWRMEFPMIIVHISRRCGPSELHFLFLELYISGKEFTEVCIWVRSQGVVIPIHVFRLFRNRSKLSRSKLSTMTSGLRCPSDRVALEMPNKCIHRIHKSRQPRQTRIPLESFLCLVFCIQFGSVFPAMELMSLEVLFPLSKTINPPPPKQNNCRTWLAFFYFCLITSDYRFPLFLFTERHFNREREWNRHFFLDAQLGIHVHN